MLIAALQKIAAFAVAACEASVIETYVLTILNPPELIVEVVCQVGSDRVRTVMDFVNHFQTLSLIYGRASRINHIFETI